MTDTHLTETTRPTTDHASDPKLATTRRTLMRAAIASAAGVTAAGTIAANQALAQDATPETIAPEGQPNILVIMGDDIGLWNISIYNHGMMGYRTPNIDRIGREGMYFTDAYGQQSCTAGRAAFITGQHPFRTQLLSIGLPGQDQGIQPEDPTLAEILKPLGYATGQFGKNHLGDLNTYLPTVHGFDEFFGNLYHLNAEEEPENPDYPADPSFRAQYGPRGVLHSWASDVDDPTEDPRFGIVGKQVIEDTGALTSERMKTIDDELLAASLDFIDRAVEGQQPFFVWHNSTRMHINTHLKEGVDGATGLGVYADGMVEHDAHVGQLLQKLDDLGVADNTIVIYTTDNGAEVFSWPDGGTTPFRGEKNSNWEGAYRIPQLVRWPGHVPAGTVSNGIFSLQDWFPTLASAVGLPTIAEDLLTGYQAGEQSFNVHIDGFDQLAHLSDPTTPSAREQFFFFNDDNQLVGLRLGRWKFVLREQSAEGFSVWIEPFDQLRTPRLIDLRTDPFERAIEESANYDMWMLDHIFLYTPATGAIREFLQTFLQFPPRVQREPVLPAVIDVIVESLQ